MLCAYDILCKLSTIPHINSETNPLTLMINVVCKYLRQFLCTSFGVATLPICCNIKWWGRWLIYYCKVEHPRIFRNFSRNCLGLNNLCEILWVCKYPTFFIRCPLKKKLPSLIWKKIIDKSTIINPHNPLVWYFFSRYKTVDKYNTQINKDHKFFKR